MPTDKSRHGVRVTGLKPRSLTVISDVAEDGQFEILVVRTTSEVVTHCQLSSTTVESNTPSPASYTPHRIVISLPCTTGTVVVSHPVAPFGPLVSNLVPWSCAVPSGQLNVFPPARHGGPLAHPHTRKLAAFSETGLPSSSYATFPSGCPATAGLSSAKKTSL